MKLGLRELIRRTPRGECPFCGDPCERKVSDKKRNTPGARPHFYDPDFFMTCGDEVCLAAYHRFYKRDERNPEKLPKRKVSRAEMRRRMSEGQRRRWAPQESHP